MIAIYRFLTRLGGPLIRAHIRRRDLRGKEDHTRLNERFGEPTLPRPSGALLWLHGASVGETISVLPLIDALLARDPALNILLTSGTVTSAALMAERLPARACHQFLPVDIPSAVAGFLDHWRPNSAVWVESEIWPNLLLAARQRQIPTALVNARMSPRSYGKWRKFPNTARRLFGSFRLCLAQSEEDAERFRQLGAPKVEYLGNLKDMAAPLPFDDLSLNQLRARIGERPIWLAASTHPGEEEHILQTHSRLKAQFPDLLSLIAPRHPERGNAVADLVKQAGLSLARRSFGELPEPGTDIYLADTLGDMGLLYQLCGLVFMGGSLAPIGGHNPLEPARMGAALVFGPHMENFRDSAWRLLHNGGAERISDASELSDSVAILLGDVRKREAMSQAGIAATASNVSALGAIVVLIEREILQSAGPEKLHAGA